MKDYYCMAKINILFMVTLTFGPVTLKLAWWIDSIKVNLKVDETTDFGLKRYHYMAKLNILYMVALIFGPVTSKLAWWIDSIKIHMKVF